MVCLTSAQRVNAVTTEGPAPAAVSPAPLRGQGFCVVYWKAGGGGLTGASATDVGLMSSVLFQSPDAADDLRYIDDRNNSGKIMAKGILFVLLESHHGSRGFPSCGVNPKDLNFLPCEAMPSFVHSRMKPPTLHFQIWVGHLHCALVVTNLLTVCNKHAWFSSGFVFWSNKW